MPKNTRVLFPILLVLTALNLANGLTCMEGVKIQAPHPNFFYECRKGNEILQKCGNGEVFEPKLKDCVKLSYFSRKNDLPVDDNDSVNDVGFKIKNKRFVNKNEDEETKEFSREENNDEVDLENNSDIKPSCQEGLKIHTSSPGFFYECKEGKLILQKCTKGDIFEPNLKRCVEFRDVSQKNEDSTDDNDSVSNDDFKTKSIEDEDEDEKNFNIKYKVKHDNIGLENNLFDREKISNCREGHKIAGSSPDLFYECKEGNLVVRKCDNGGTFEPNLEKCVQFRDVSRNNKFRISDLMDKEQKEKIDREFEANTHPLNLEKIDREFEVNNHPLNLEKIDREFEVNNHHINLEFNVFKTTSGYSVISPICVEGLKILSPFPGYFYECKEGNQIHKKCANGGVFKPAVNECVQNQRVFSQKSNSFVIISKNGEEDNDNINDSSSDISNDNDSRIDSNESDYSESISTTPSTETNIETTISEIITTIPATEDISLVTAEDHATTSSEAPTIEIHEVTITEPTESSTSEITPEYPDIVASSTTPITVPHLLTNALKVKDNLRDQILRWAFKYFKNVNK